MAAMGSTREKILGLLKRRKRATARELAATLKVTAPAVRQHLTALERDGLVSGRAEKRPMGRPVRVYHLTPAAEPHFPTAYGPLALDLLRLLQKAGGRKAVHALLERRRKALLTAYRKRIRSGGTARAWETLAKLRDDEGYVCETVTGDDSPALVEHHCPIRAVAKEFPEVCRQEQLLFESVLGKKLERQEHLIDGGHCCMYVPASKAGKGESKKPAKKKAKKPAKKKAKKKAAKGRPAPKRKPAKRKAAKKRKTAKKRPARKRAGKKKRR